MRYAVRTHHRNDNPQKKEMKMNDKSRGLHRKFTVKRTDGQSKPGKKHEDCEYFVLDITHDPFALPALEAYAESCRNDYPELAKDLKNIALASRWSTSEWENKEGR